MYGRSGVVPDFDLVKRIWVPQMTVRSFVPDGSTKFRRISALPGYLLIEAILTYELYTALQQVRLPHVFGWLKCRGSWPSEVSFSEIQVLYRLESLLLEPQRVPFDAGEIVALSGLGVSGKVLAASQSHLIVEINMFNRKIPINVRRGMFSEVIRSEES